MGVRELVRVIEERGGFAGAAGWREAFLAVPRHLFVPYYYVAGAGGYRRLWAEDPDPAVRERWARGVYEDVPLAIRVRDGELVSSSSQPSLMALMLGALGVREGERVLEIGAGSGYNAGLLAYRLGDRGVVSVDLEPEIVESARRHLAGAGFRPRVVVGDGARGVPEGAPYDRVVATCGVGSVPEAWVRQCRVGGRVLVPVATGLVLLRVVGEGWAEGRFLRTPAYFVPLRGRNTPWEGRGEGRGEEDGVRFLVSLSQGVLGVEEAGEVWEREGRPGRERFGVSVGEGRVWAWLDSPEGAYVWGLR
ncbi:methyltransferase domain-containing protein [Streptomyces sp. NPDC004539]|uniref:methyltransferase domain-containing protein n=1 Tax=Streptomyces sp. NPDC004539 TaxID=3154280 RepID=UPI0033B98342